MRPCHWVRPKIRLTESGTDLITILRCFLSFKTVVMSRNIIAFKIKFPRPKTGYPSRARSLVPRAASGPEPSLLSRPPPHPIHTDAWPQTSRQFKLADDSEIRRLGECGAPADIRRACRQPADGNLPTARPRRHAKHLPTAASRLALLQRPAMHHVPADSSPPSLPEAARALRADAIRRACRLEPWRAAA